MAEINLTYGAKTKTGNEAWIYYSLQVGIIKEVRTLTDAGVQAFDMTNTGCGNPICPDPSFDASVIEIPNTGSMGNIPQQAPVGFASEEVADPTTIGDSVSIACLPNPAEDELICYDQGFSASPGLSYRPIARKFQTVDHYVRQRSENTLSMNDLFVSNRDGLQRIQGRPVTIIVKISPDGTGQFSEIQYYCNVILNPQPMNSGGDGNASIDVSLEGTFDFFAVFSAAKP
jgi:hypothetical protein